MERETEPKHSLFIEVETPGLDEAIEKANRLVELLREASSIIDSLRGEKQLET